MKEISSQVKGHFLRLYQIAMTDADFSPLEWKQLYHFAEQRNISSNELENILLTTTGNIEIPKTLNERIEYLYDLVIMCLADDRIDDEERNTLRKYAKKFEFEDENIDEMLDFLIKSCQEKKTVTTLLSEINSKEA